MKIRVQIFITCLVLFALQAKAQDRYLTREGKAKFYSHTPMEDIEAVNNNVLSIIDLTKGEVAVDMLIKNFEFPKKLMQEHFNENYMESEKLPKSTFKGSFQVPDGLKAMKAGSYEAEVKGDITIHGVTKPLQTKVTLVVADGKISTEFVFRVKVKDHDIQIPNLVVKNIAEEMEVTCTFEYQPFKR